MPMHIKGGFKSKNGLVTYGDGGAYGAAPSARRAKDKAQKGKELKEVPPGKEGAGLRALSRSVRNNMGYARYGYSMDPKKTRK
mgnify:CR=1 FL=1|tara:strand:+ start:434 stop:682 length:249 start_codon:yes stop_codon:yes gene_type:complete